MNVLFFCLCLDNTIIHKNKIKKRELKRTKVKKMLLSLSAIPIGFNDHTKKLIPEV